MREDGLALISTSIALFNKHHEEDLPAARIVPIPIVLCTLDQLCHMGQD
jgi:hypothetical protein